LSNYTMGGQTFTNDTYLRYPNLRDLIPEDATLTSVQIIVTQDMATNPFLVEAKAITQSWNPTTNPLAILPTTVSQVPPITNTWDLSPGSPRADRSIDITAIATDWFSGIQSDYGICLSIPTPDINPNGITGFNLPVLVVKYDIQGIPSDPSHGGSYYMDNITPPVLIPGRSVFVDRIGDVDNPIHSFSITAYSMDQLIPFGEDTLSVNLTYEDVFPTTQSNIPFQTPRPISNNCFLTYSFPVLNGDPVSGTDIYPNNALSVVLPDNDTTPPGVLPSAPYLSQSIPYINLGTTNPHHTVDISVLVNTPISTTVYPNYPITNFTSVMQADASLMGQPNFSVQKPLSSLPMVETISARDIGTNGELETKAFVRPSGVNFPMAINIGNNDFVIDPIGFSIGDGYSKNHFGFDLKGCLEQQVVQSSPNFWDPCDPSNSKKERIIPLPRDPTIGPWNDEMIMSDHNGGCYSFQKVLNPTQTAVPTVTTYYNPKVTNSKLICDTSKPSTQRFELQTPTGDISRWYNENGQIQKITSSIGAELIYNYNAQGQVISVEDGYSNRSMSYFYDAYDRLVEIRNPLNEQVQYQYNANNQITSVIDPQGKTYHFDYDAVSSLLTGVSITTSSMPVKDPLFYIQPITPPGLEDDPCLYAIGVDVSHTTADPGEDAHYYISCTCPYPRMIDIEQPDGSKQTVTLYHEGTIASIEDEDGCKKSFFPDSENASPATKEESLDDGNPNTEDEKKTYMYDNQRNLTSITDADGNAATIAYNSDNKPIAYTDREGNTTTINYTPDGSSIQSVVSPSGKTVTIQYNGNQQVASKTYTWKTGQTATYSYTYDANGYINTITDPLNQVTDRDYDDLGRLIKTTDSLGRYSEMTLNPGGSLSQITYSNSTGTQTKDVDLTYNDLGQLISITDPKGNSTSYAYDVCGRLESTTDALNNTTSYAYDIMDQIISVTDAKNRVTTFTYNDQHQLITVTDPDNKSTGYQYDGHGRLLSSTDPLGHTTSFEYDVLNRVTSVTDALNNETTYTYDKEGHVLSTTDPLNHTYTMTYDEEYRLVSVTNPLNQVTSTYTYYPFGPVETITNLASQSVTYDYDELGRMTSFTDIKGRTSTFTYDSVDRLTQMTDSASRSTSYQYDIFNNVTQITNPLSETTSFAYDLNGNQTQVTTPLGKIYSATYDALNRVVTTTDPLNHTYTTTYDEVGNTTSIRDPLNHLTQWQYNVRDLIDQTTDALNQTSENTYDDARRLTEFEDTLDRTTGFVYDNINRLTQVTSPANHTASYQYDAVGNLTQRTRNATTGLNPTSASVTTYAYDALYRPTTSQDPFNNQTSFTYNTMSQLTQISLPGNETIQNTYDTWHKLTQVSASDNHTVSYTYDALDRITQTTDSITGSFSYTYDNLDRPTQVTGPDSKVSTFTYDHDGRTTQTSYDGNATNYTYDDASRLTQLQAPGSRTYINNYDNANRLTTEALPSTVNVHYVYDAINRPTSLTYVIPDGGSIFSQPNSDNSSKINPRINPSNLNITRTNQPSFLEIGHLTERVFRDIILTWKLNQGTLETIKQKYGIDSEEAWEYQVAINNLFRLSALGDITIASFTPTYSAASRILTEEDFMDGTTTNYTYTRDNEDQLLTASTPSGTYTYTYDERNNRLTKRLVTPSTDTTEYYTYNVADQMTAMTKKDTSTQTVIESYEYTYDNQGRRITKTKTSVIPNEVTSYTYYVGGNLKQITLPDSSTIQYQYDAYGNRTKQTTSTELITYHYSGASLQTEIHKNPNTLVVLYTLKYYPWGFTKTVGQDTVPYYYIFDHRGNTRAITDSQGDILEEYYYSPYGILLSTPTITQPHFLSGNAQCQYDTDASLYYMHARYYDAQTGRFLTKDSIPGSLASPLSQNRYTYCQNDPITLIDPTGNSPENTGNPPRMSGPNVQSNYDPCMLPEVNTQGNGTFVDGVANQHLDDMNDACSFVPDYRRLFREADGQITDNGDGTKTYTLEIDEEEISITIDKNGKVTKVVSESGSDKGKIIAKAINDACWDLQNRGGTVGNIFNFMLNLNDFAYNNYKTWLKIYTGSNPLYTFFFHATRGAAITNAMLNDPRAGGDHGQFDMIFGFWVSYHLSIAEEKGWKIPWKSTYSNQKDGKGTLLGMVDITRGMKALMYCEHGGTQGNFSDVGGLPLDQETQNKNTEGEVTSTDYGLMQINDKTFVQGWDDYQGLLYQSIFFENLQGYDKDDNLWKKNAFGNIGASIGIVLNRAYRSEKGVMYGGSMPSLWHWAGFIYGYNSRVTNADKSKLAYYKCWIRFLNQINKEIDIPTDYSPLPD
jgi:RHS repeat-associated protein